MALCDVEILEVLIALYRIAPHSHAGQQNGVASVRVLEIVSSLMPSSPRLASLGPPTAAL